MVRIWSRPYGLCHRPYTLAHIKGFGSPDFHVYACLLLCLISMLASLDLGFAMFDALSGFVVVWLHPMPMRPCSGVTTWDASPCDDMLTMLVCATCWLSMHLYTLAYISMHKSCLLVCFPHFNTMKLWTFNPNLHLYLVDTTFCLPSFLFAFLLSSLFVYLYLSSILPCHACHIYLACLLCTLCALSSKKGKDASMWIKAKRLCSIGLGV